MHSPPSRISHRNTIFSRHSMLTSRMTGIWGRSGSEVPGSNAQEGTTTTSSLTATSPLSVTTDVLQSGIQAASSTSSGSLSTDTSESSAASLSSTPASTSATSSEQSPTSSMSSITIQSVFSTGSPSSATGTSIATSSASRATSSAQPSHTSITLSIATPLAPTSSPEDGTSSSISDTSIPASSASSASGSAATSSGAPTSVLSDAAISSFAAASSSSPALSSTPQTFSISFATLTQTPQAVVSNAPTTSLQSNPSSSSSMGSSQTAGNTSKLQSSGSRSAIVAGVTGSIGGVAILLGLGYLVFWCRKRKKNRDSFVSTDPLWRRSQPEVRESFGNDGSLRAPTPRFAPPLRRGHSSGMAMVEVSDDPFGATPPSFPQPLDTPPIAVESAPFDTLYSETPSSTTNLVFPVDHAYASPGWAQRAFPVIPAIRIQSATTDSYAEDDHRSSYADSTMVPLETPVDNFPNPFADPVDYIVPDHASTETVNVPPSPQSVQSGSVLRSSSQAHMPSRTNSRLTMSSLRAEVVPSPVDTIDRFWDLPGTPGPYASSQLSASTPTSSESLLRSVSPGPGPTSRSGYP